MPEPEFPDLTPEEENALLAWLDSLDQGTDVPLEDLEGLEAA